MVRTNSLVSQCIFIFAFFLLVLVSCKKKEDQSFPSVGLALNTSRVNGLFEVVKSHGQGTSYPGNPDNYSCFAFVSDSLIYEDAYKGNVDPGNVSLDGIALFKMTQTVTGIPYFSYNESQSMTYTAPFVWSISGGGLVQPFTFTNFQNFPSYNASDLPDTLKIRNGGRLTLTHLADYDSISVNIDDGSHTFIKGIKTASSTVAIEFTQQDFMGWGYPTDKVILNINMFKNNFQSIHDKLYNFRTTYCFFEEFIYISI